MKKLIPLYGIPVQAKKTRREELDDILDLIYKDRGYVNNKYQPRMTKRHLELVKKGYAKVTRTPKIYPKNHGSSKSSKISSPCQTKLEITPLGIAYLKTTKKYRP
jgi:hypothetical protein